uniref:Uncharacterized protein n=1 Tax=Trichobilharzia regenti TaxID=157069 RepID=A0AA85IXI0_TRIRE|nr:unnamed protein product [Trichobilharzia regenti]CAH8862348.1 unnamed protein product [Trichobilharzia regenti]
MLSKVWLTIISAIVLYIMCLPQCESSFLWELFCHWFKHWCTEDAKEAVDTVLKAVGGDGSSSKVGTPTL